MATTKQPEPQHQPNRDFETDTKSETESEVEEEEEEEENQGWEDWQEDEDDGGEETDTRLLCLFCDSAFGSGDELFGHCRGAHWFDFARVRKELGLDFYGCFKLINYVRSQVACNRCWSCGLAFPSNQELLNHLHETVDFKGINHLWEDDQYLQPFMEDDSLLYSFNDDEEGEEDYTVPAQKEDFIRDLVNVNIDTVDANGRSMISFGASSNGHVLQIREHAESSDAKQRDKHSRSSILNLAAKDVKKVNEDYFGSYSSFGIHREMLSDKVRTDVYREAILRNPSQLTGAVVMDVGCGTGILSLFAAQAGASRVIAVEASEKMAAVATQIAEDNGLLRVNTLTEGNRPYGQVIEVVHSMVEELDKSLHIEPHSVDVLMSEWMGYCLLYESMLSSVLFARDKWLKPGGAILPDTATIYAAGFGKGGTSLPFWEDVYGFNMSSVGKELVQDAAKMPIVDVVDGCDLVTHAAILQTFDLTTMKPEEVDFTAIIELEPKLDSIMSSSMQSTPKTTWCYGIVLWFDTSFTKRFCKETPAVLSTSPYGPKTHWSQTIFTFREPIAMAAEEFHLNKSALIGTDVCPAARVHLRISIARAAQHRSIDISLEATGIRADGRKHSWPVQLFNLS